MPHHPRITAEQFEAAEHIANQEQEQTHDTRIATTALVAFLEELGIETPLEEILNPSGLRQYRLRHPAPKVSQ